MSNNEKGSKAYLYSIVLVAVLGVLLFGYDTAVISGAEKGLQVSSLARMAFSTPMPCMGSLAPPLS